MRRSLLLILLLVVSALAMMYAYPRLGSYHRFEVKGRLVGFSDDPRLVIIEHEEIPGYMQAMTMPFRVSDPADLQELQLGDVLQFRFIITADSAWIDNIRKLPDEVIAIGPAGIPSGPAMLMPGEPVPDFELFDQAGESLSLNDLRGKAVILSFIYTRCPIPDFCPLMSRHFTTLQPELKRLYGQDVRLLSISFDADYDTPEVLQDYAKRYTSDLETWSFASGTADEIAKITALFGVFYRDESADEIVHNLSTAMIDEEGRLVKIWRGNEWEPEEVLDALGTLQRP